MFKNLFRSKALINPEEQFAEWIQNGKPTPPPHIVKQKAIEDYRKKSNIDILVETGTYLGEMVEAHRNNFKSIISIELSERLYHKAKKRFGSYSHIQLLQGDSGKVLNELVRQLTSPVIFWLDGHYSGGITSLGDKECPVREELAAIFSGNTDHVILIDDARLFNGTNDYPTIEEIRNITNKNGEKYSIEIIDDIIRITPN